MYRIYPVDKNITEKDVLVEFNYQNGKVYAIHEYKEWNHDYYLKNCFTHNPSVLGVIKDKTFKEVADFFEFSENNEGKKLIVKSCLFQKNKMAKKYEEIFEIEVTALCNYIFTLTTKDDLKDDNLVIVEIDDSIPLQIVCEYTGEFDLVVRKRDDTVLYEEKMNKDKEDFKFKFDLLKVEQLKYQIGFEIKVVLPGFGNNYIYFQSAHNKNYADVII